MTARPRRAPIPLTGFAMCNALGGNKSEVRDALFAGRTGLVPCPIALPFPTWAGTISAPLADLPPELSGWSTRAAQIAATLVAELEPELAAMRKRWKPERIAIILGTSTAGADATEAAYREFVATGDLPTSYDLWKHHTYGAVLHVVRALTGATGPAWMISTACTSSAKPFATAQRLIEAGAIDAAIVGGIDTLCAMTLNGFHCLGALAETPCVPFAATRTGISIGEGGAFVLMEREAEPIAWLDAVGESSDAYHISAPHPEGAGAQAAMERALAQAGCTAQDIDHVNAHGTGTRLNDSAESQAILRVLGAEVPVVSTKGFTGHTLGAAGATEAAICLFALLEGWIPGSLGADPLDPAVGINVSAERRTGTFKRVLSNSFAFGGNNVSILLRAV